MSHTFYDGENFSIDATHEYIWFFEYVNDETNHARVKKEQLPAIRDAIDKYLKDES